ncbi:MurR/RpiR family transcriptional regulator [Loigolactobacillus coryniformis]|uniref:MurR/RpiR family transcriptional regulator n=1 Tax=Loigolactobacillus coryniformis TaxID=1610 RepID=UPI0023421EA9|nr:MurR/RpiR family transcriptional regulator [Loigolactobacillus coryniformis]MDC4186479.1 MurR/RpiR family transcriptional regulator [Loigolactobacillus coryniformis]
MVLNLQTFINQKYSSLGETDKEILTFITQNKDFVQKASLQQVADKSLYSKSSIFRTCKKLGLTGYSQLHYILGEEGISTEATITNVDFLSQTVKSMLWTVNQFKNTKLDDLYADIYASNNIYIYATGWIQQIMAQQLQRNLYLLQKNGFVFPAAVNELLMPGKHLKPGDVLIVISFSGKSDTVVKFINNLKLQGVKIISFTSFKQNKVAQAADHNLYYDTISKTVDVDQHHERFFANLDILIDIFCMGLANYVIQRNEGIIND